MNKMVRLIPVPEETPSGTDRAIPKPPKVERVDDGVQVTLFDAMQRIPVPRAGQTEQDRYPLEEKDPYAEWSNPHTEKNTPITRVLETLPDDYLMSAGWIRANRPRESLAGMEFWSVPVSKAHIMNALLLRGDRHIKTVEQDLDIPTDKIYSYLPRWKIEFNMISRAGTLIDANTTPYDVTVQEWRRKTASAIVQINGYMLVLEARFDTQTRVWRTQETLNLSEYSHITYEVAALLANLRVTTVKSAFPADVRTPRGHKLISLERFTTVFPEDTWEMSLDEALRFQNPCNCAYYSYHHRACSLKRDIPPLGTAYMSCEDHHEQK